MRICRLGFMCAVVTFLLASCTPTINYNFLSTAHVDTLNLSLRSTAMVPQTVMAGFDSTLQAFITKYNSESHAFKLVRAESSVANTIRINVLETTFVSSDKQAAGAVVTLLGFTMPFLMIAAEAPIFIFFYYFPNVVSLTEVTFSSDLGSVPPALAYRPYASPGFLKNLDSQKNTHIDRFGTSYLRMLMVDLERSYKLKNRN